MNTSSTAEEGDVMYIIIAFVRTDDFIGLHVLFVSAYEKQTSMHEQQTEIFPS